MRITPKGQVTIPRAIRESAGLLPGFDVDFVVEDGAVRIVLARSRKSRGERLVESMRGKGNFKISADEVIALMRGPPAEV